MSSLSDEIPQEVREVLTKQLGRGCTEEELLDTARRLEGLASFLYHDWVKEWLKKREATDLLEIPVIEPVTEEQDIDSHALFCLVKVC